MKKIVVLVSGGGTNLQRIIDCVESGEIADAQISLVVADRDCYGLERAKKHQIKAEKIPRGKNFYEELKKILPENTDLIVLAGFLSILPAEFCETFPGKIINIHPALLPKFGGKGMWGNYVHEAVLKAGEKESGATVHYVTAGIDEGEIILQKSFEVKEGETLETLAQKIHNIEFEIFPAAINLALGNK
ncbi:phosphoribosylglycinamide formyltransferase [Kaistella solincola]|uniref:Phosphoribosylglycinamide formyltransferase n=1 Tax=Kaistella solincola TaxID=510955 RepID=A0ABR4ZQT9_9FLAO|nr:phosphoribosylglycinamide formyltransferase [Kaistella solincola]KIA83111.1 phosphoribosylglycinamide formyltransferase [Kaistella solincola]